VSQYSNILSPTCVDAVLKVIDPAKDTNVDLRDIKLIQKLGCVESIQKLLIIVRLVLFDCKENSNLWYSSLSVNLYLVVFVGKTPSVISQWRV